MDYTFPQIYRDDTVSGGGSSDPGLGTVVTTWQGLYDACNAHTKVIQLGANLATEATALVEGANLYVPADVIVRILPYKIVQSDDHTIKWLGGLSKERSQVFEGFLAGQIKGTFQDGYVVPEWFGLIGSNENDGEHDVAINCAIQCNGFYAPIAVSLGARAYYIKRPLDLRESSTRLQGVSSFVTQLYTTTTWDPGDWECFFNIDVICQPPNKPPILTLVDAGGGMCTLTVAQGGLSEFFAGDGNEVELSGATNAAHNGSWLIDEVVSGTSIRIVLAYGSGPGATLGFIQPITLDSVMESGVGAGSAMILIGSILPETKQDFFGGVRGVYLNGYNACVAYPLKRMSLIAWTGWVEENTIIDDVYIEYYTGFAIGGQSADNNNVINGLTISKFSINAGMRRFATAIFVPRQGGVFSVRDGTINSSVIETLSIAGTDPALYKWAPPQFGVLCGGSHTILEGLHIESCVNAIHVFSREVSANVSIRQCKFHYGINYGMRWTTDTDRAIWSLPDYPAELALDNYGGQNGALFHVGCCVSIGANPYEYLGGYGGYQNVLVEGLAVSGNNRFTLIDAAFGVWLDVFDGYYPAAKNNSVGFYTRGLPQKPSERVAYTVAGTADALQGGGAGSGTLLNVSDSAGFILNTLSGVYPDSVANSALTGSFYVRAKPSSTSLVIQFPYDVAHLGSTGTIWTTLLSYNSAVPSAEKRYFVGPVGHKDLYSVTGGGGGNVTQTFADATARGAAVPDFEGQLGVQLDDDTFWISDGLSAGDWIQFVTGSSGGLTAVAEYNRTINGATSTGDPYCSTVMTALPEGRIDFYIDNLLLIPGDGVKTADYYWSVDSGTSALALSAVNALYGTALPYKGSTGPFSAGTEKGHYLYCVASGTSTEAVAQYGLTVGAAGSTGTVYCASAISVAPTGRIDVYLDNMLMIPGSAVKTADYYWSADSGTTALALSAVNAAYATARVYKGDTGPTTLGTEKMNFLYNA